MIFFVKLISHIAKITLNVFSKNYVKSMHSFNLKNSNLQFVLGEPILQSMVLERVIRSALTSKDTMKVQTSEIVTPKSNTRVYWLYNELANLVTKQRSLEDVLETLRHGQDAVWNPQDPLPFLALNYIQMPVLLIKAFFRGQPFRRVDFAQGAIY